MTFMDFIGAVLTGILVLVIIFRGWWFICTIILSLFNALENALKNLIGR